MLDFTKLTTKIHTSLHGKLVGKDEFGNEYYTSSQMTIHNRPRRWVVYNGMAEASKVPAEWHLWLHYSVDDPIQVTSSKKDGWMEEFTPNLTGTKMGLSNSQPQEYKEQVKYWKPE